MGKGKEKAKDRFELNRRTVGVVSSFVTLIIVVCIFLYLSLGWFTNNTITKSDGMNVGVVGVADGSFELYQAQYVDIDGTDTETWIKIDALDITNMVANETRRYMVVGTSDLSTLDLKITEFNSNSSTVDTDKITDYFYTKKVDGYTYSRILKDNQTNVLYTDGTYAPLLNTDNYTYSQLDDVSFTNSLNSQNTIEFTQEDENIFVFDVYSNEDVCNCFSSWEWSGSITVR